MIKMFNRNHHSLNELFKQLGLQSDDEAISVFISSNKSIDNKRLHQLEIWTSTQSDFIKECLENDADWSGIVDELNIRLCIT